MAFCRLYSKKKRKNDFVLYTKILFQEPNPEDPLNKEAADELQSNRRLFEQHVQRAMRGGYVGSSYFERCLKWTLHNAVN